MQAESSWRAWHGEMRCFVVRASHGSVLVQEEGALRCESYIEGRRQAVSTLWRPSTPVTRQMPQANRWMMWGRISAETD